MLVVSFQVGNKMFWGHTRCYISTLLNSSIAPGKLLALDVNQFYGFILCDMYEVRELSSGFKPFSKSGKQAFDPLKK